MGGGVARGAYRAVGAVRGPFAKGAKGSCHLHKRVARYELQLPGSYETRGMHEKMFLERVAERT